MTANTSALDELVSLLKRGADATDYASEQVERDVFWKEKRKWVDSKTPTGYFEQPVFNKYRSFGRVETQFVSDPYYIEIDNRPWGILRDEKGRSLNPDTFHRVFNDAELKKMLTASPQGGALGRSPKGAVVVEKPTSNQETRFPIQHGSDGYSNDIDLRARITRMREGSEKVVEDTRREALKLDSISRFRRNNGIYNPGESIQERTGLGTRGTDLASRNEYNIHRPFQNIRDYIAFQEARLGRRPLPSPDINENIFFQEDTPSQVPLTFAPRFPSPSTPGTPITPTPLPTFTREEIIPQTGSSSYQTPVAIPETIRKPMPPTPPSNPQKKFRDILLKEGNLYVNPNTGKTFLVDSEDFKVMYKAFRNNQYRPFPHWKYIKGEYR